MIETLRRIAPDMTKCIHCGVCTGTCSSGALTLRRPEMTLKFRPEKCLGCELCIQVCPVRAIRVN
ncbi:MAG TPA: 4Fe-4S binding protein [Firmicutes bacterium]|nr:4Fe-4S binding protein [Bacillota bacterium]